MKINKQNSKFKNVIKHKFQCVMVACHVIFQCQHLILVLLEKIGFGYFLNEPTFCFWTPCRQNIIIQQKLKLINILNV